MTSAVVVCVWHKSGADIVSPITNIAVSGLFYSVWPGLHTMPCKLRV